MAQQEPFQELYERWLCLGSLSVWGGAVHLHQPNVVDWFGTATA